MKRILALLFLSVGLAHGQESLSYAPLRSADVVAIGTLYRDFMFPWIDGWNERGHLDVERVLKGDIGQARSLPFAWERDFHQGWCLTRPDWRGMVGKRGIWILIKDGHRYRADDMFTGYLEMDKHLNEVIRFLSGRAN